MTLQSLLAVSFPFTFVLVCIGGAITFKAISEIRLGITATGWPYVVVNIEGIQSEHIKEGRNRGPTVKVRYSYTVNGRLLSGSTIHPAYWGSRSIKEQRKLANTFSSADRIRCTTIRTDQLCPHCRSVTIPAVWHMYFLALRSA